MDAKHMVDALVAEGWTQKQIEERTGIPQPTISKIARADVSDVMSKTYLALLALYQSEFGPRKKAKAA
jgi:transcriptional regulator with XRE-family HTH domain